MVHTYYDHVSIIKFIERNWALKPLTARSRDNLPNPATASGNPYVPVNSPAIGDCFEMFDFAHPDFSVRPRGCLERTIRRSENLLVAAAGGNRVEWRRRFHRAE